MLILVKTSQINCKNIRNIWAKYGMGLENYEKNK